MNATALYTPDKCEVWCPTQNGEAALAAAAEASGLPIAKCDVHKTLLGGGFGRRGRSDYVAAGGADRDADAGHAGQADLVARRGHDALPYHPITQCKLRGGLDAVGQPGRACTCASPGSRSWPRCLPQNLKDGMDPVVFQGLNPGGAEGAVRLQHSEPADRPCDAQPAPPAGVLARRQHQPERDLHRMLHGRAGACRRAGSARIPPQDAEAEMARRARRRRRKGRLGQGAGRPFIRASRRSWATAAMSPAVAEVSVSKEGRLKIHRIVAATNPGHAVNPAQIERQVAGSFVYGLSAMLYGEITVSGGAVEQTNFDSYNVMRIDEMPKVETVIVPTGDFWGGVGEPTIAVAAPAVLNAIFAATGKRIRTMPLMNHDLRSA